MKITAVSLTDIQIESRQRTVFDPEKLNELAASIDDNGLIQPVVVRNDKGLVRLVAGERRLRAIEIIWNFGGRVRCGSEEYAEGYIPCIQHKDIEGIQAFEMELEENIRREDLNWQDRSRAVSHLNELRRLQAKKSSMPEPMLKDIAKEAYPNNTSAERNTRRDLILARYLDDEDVAKAPNAKEALKILERKESARQAAAHGEQVGKTFSAKDHQLIQGNCIEILSTFGPLFDCILTDPPYGINAQEFNDSDGKASGGHEYNDSYDNWINLMRSFVNVSMSVTKPAAHFYAFCDIDNFIELRDLVASAGWKVFRTPLVWHNPSAQRAPWPDMGPLRRYQLCLYATKANRPTLRLAPDVLTYASDPNLGWSAQKPVGLLKDLLSRSLRPGDTVVDPFCGSGSIFPASHELKVRATGIEMNPTAYGIAAKRLGELK